MKKQIKFSSLQRFNLEDAQDLQGLVDEQLTLENYGLKGGSRTSTLTGGMILSPFSVNSVGAGNSSPTAWIVLNPFNFMLPNGEVVEHTNAALQISYSTLRSDAISANAARTGYLWGNYNDVDAENEAREFWDTLSETEVVQNVNTRTIKTPTFVITTTSGQPAAISGRLWTRLATVSVTSSGGTFKVVNTSAIKQFNEMPGMQYYKPLEVTSSTSSTRFGLGTYWNNIEEMFYKIITNGNSDDSTKTSLGYGANPQYSLQGLKREIEKKDSIGVVASCLLKFNPNPSLDTSAISTWEDDEFWPYLRSDVEVLQASGCNCDATQFRFDGRQSVDPAITTAYSVYKNGVFQVIVTSNQTDANNFGQGRVLSDAAALSIYNTNRVVLTAYAKHDTLPGVDVDSGIDGTSVDNIFITNEPVHAQQLFSIVTAPWYPDEGTSKTQVSKLYPFGPTFDNNTYATFINFEPFNMYTYAKKTAIFTRYFVQNNISQVVQNAFNNHLATTLGLGDDFGMPTIFLKVEFYGDVTTIN
jgi:hypothetical protein